MFDGDKNTIKNLLGVAEIGEYEKYLGLLVVDVKNKWARSCGSSHPDLCYKLL